MTLDPSAPENTTGVRLLVGVHELYHRIDEAMETVNIEPPLALNARKLIVLIPFPRGMGELAEVLGVTKPTFTALADELEKKGYIRRERAAEDRRAWLLCLTEQGEKTRRELMQRAHEFTKEITGLEQDDLVELTRLLDLVRDISGHTECPYT